MPKSPGGGAVAQGLGIIWTSCLVFLGLSFGLIATASLLDVAWSAFFGIRGPADTYLGIRSTILVLVPWSFGAIAWVLSRRKQPAPGFVELIVLGMPGTLPYRLRSVAIATMIGSIVVLPFGRSFLF